MSIVTDWLIASEGEASAVASILTTEEHSFDDWPTLSLQGIGDLELGDLAKLLVQSANRGQHLGPLLYQESEEGPFVAAVHPEFVAALADLVDDGVNAVGKAWGRSQHLSDWPSSDLAQTVRQMTEFARRSREEGKPILQLMTM
jgi:hypothetical protein